MSLVVIGSVAFDTIHTPHGSAEEALGGSAVHFALAAALLAPVRLVGTVGTDLTDEHIEPLLRKPVCLKGMCRKEGKTFRWAGRYSQDMNHRETIKCELNVFGQYCPVIPPEYRDSKYVFLANGSPQHQMEVLDQMTGPQFVMLDTMDHWIQSDRGPLEAVLKRVDGIIINDSEAQLLTDEEGVAAGHKILGLGPRYAIIKRGAYGALMVSANDTFIIPAFPTRRVLDPTGAGDTFAGGVMGYLARTGDLSPSGLRRAMAYGTIIASYNVEDFGVNRVAGLNLEDVEKRLREFRTILAF